MIHFLYLKQYNEKTNTENIIQRGTFAYMCPKCFSIEYIDIDNSLKITKCDKHNPPYILSPKQLSFICSECQYIGDMTMIDPNIAESISLLNKKGYYTSACCEGHARDKGTYCYPFIEFYDNANDISKLELPKYWEYDPEFNELYVPEEDALVIDKELYLKTLYDFAVSI